MAARHKCWAYNVPREDVWIVSLPTPGPMLASSEIIVVCHRTGRILYHGPANDEG